MVRPKEFDKDTALQKALRVFWTKGYDGTSISDLTEAMEISRSSLYETFGDKRELFLVALRHYLNSNYGRWGSLFATAPTVRQGMTQFLYGAMYFILNEDQPGGCFLTNTITGLGTLDEQFQVMIQEYLEEQEAEFIAFFEQGIQRGELGSKQDPRALARFFISLVRGMSVVGKVQKDRQRLEDIISVALNVLG